MGLDMYLDVERYFFSFGNDTPPPTHAEIPEPYTIKTMKAQAAYWRKENQIHRWFVDNVQGGEDDCDDYYVSREQLATLVETCRQVLDDPDLAPTLLPTQSGFFFGSTDYDDYYFEGLRSTVDQVTKALAAFPDEGKWDFQYRSSW